MERPERRHPVPRHLQRRRRLVLVLAAYGEKSTSVSFGADNASTYVVGVRAGNDHGWSGWTNSPAAGPYTPPTPTPTPTPTPAPDAPASVTVTRGDGTVAASWDAPSGATKYHVTYSSDHKASWKAASDNHSGSSITISGADNAKTYYVASAPATTAVGAAGPTPTPLALTRRRPRPPHPPRSPSPAPTEP